METIPRADLLVLGGAPDARFAVFDPDGSLFFCTTAKAAEDDEDYWRGHGRTIKRVIGTHFVVQPDGHNMLCNADGSRSIFDDVDAP